MLLCVKNLINWTSLKFKTLTIKGKVFFKRPVINWKKIFTIYKNDKGLVNSLYKELL